MEKESEFKITAEQRSLLNAGHGPPFMHPGVAIPYIMIPSNQSWTSAAYNDRHTPKGSYEQIQTQHHQPKNVQGSSNRIELLQKANEDLRRELALKTEEIEDLRAKLHQLTEQINGENYDDDRMIHLATTNEMASGGCWTEKLPANEEDLAKSIQCSEQSIEQSHRNEYNGDVKGVFNEGHMTEKRISSTSNSSFEIVGQGFCAEQEELKQAKSFKDQLRVLKSEIEALTVRLDAEKLQRVESEARINRRVDELSANVHQGARPRSAENAEFLPLEVNSQDCCGPEMHSLKQTVSELTAAKWKLTEQLKEKERENEELKNTVEERRAIAVDVQKLEEELTKRSRQLREMESQLQAEHQCFLDAEARIRELENRNTGNVDTQQGGEEATYALAAENDLLKHQIETYKEDFEVERRDREKLVSERDTLQRYYETLRSDLDNARQQLRKYEKDISSLRSDNSAMRARLREVTEELSSHKDSKVMAPKTTNDISRTSKPAIQPQPIAKSKSSSPLTGPSADWKCRACTFSNPAQRTFCEMCGTQNDPKLLTSSSGPAEASATNISTNDPLTPRHWNASAQNVSSSILSNLRNYGDIETD